MALDAKARRSVGHPLGPQSYWEKGYTAKFDVAKEVPGDWVRYIAYRHSNTCVEKDRALGIILLDIADISGRKIEKIFETPYSFMSPQSYWDAFSKVAVMLPEKEATPEQPMIFTTIPLYKDQNNHWLIQQREVQKLRKFIRSEWQEDISQTNKFSRCDAPISRDPSACKLNEQNKQILIKYSRLAWSIYPKDMKLGIETHQSVKP